MKISGWGRYFKPKTGKFLAYTSKGMPVLNFTLSEGRKRKDKWENSNWSCIWWGDEYSKNEVERIAESLPEKSRIYVEGNVWIRSWEYQGRKQYRTEITVEKLEVMNGNEQQEENEDDIPL